MSRRGSIVSAAVAATLIVSLGPVAVAARPAVKHPLPPPPPTPKAMAHIEGFAPLQNQSFCRTHVEPGVAAFERLTLAAYQNSHSDGDTRRCGSDTSEHYDGRAWDWGVDHRTAATRADGKSMLRWLFKTDADGNEDAMFRRLGLMYIIWNKRIWGTWDKRWEPYKCSGANACHVTHIHFSFGWAGAEKKTSYWTGKVSPVLPPDYPVFASRHGHRSVVVKAAAGSASPPWWLKRGVAYDVVATGVWHHNRTRRGLADARCTQGGHTWHSSPSGGVSIHLAHPTTSARRWAPIHDTGRGCNTSTHSYRTVVTPSATGSLTISLPDAGRGNDSGSITVTFRRA